MHTKVQKLKTMDLFFQLVECVSVQYHADLHICVWLPDRP